MRPPSGSSGGRIRPRRRRRYPPCVPWGSGRNPPARMPQCRFATNINRTAATRGTGLGESHEVEEGNRMPQGGRQVSAQVRGYAGQGHGGRPGGPRTIPGKAPAYLRLDGGIAICGILYGLCQESRRIARHIANTAHANRYIGTAAFIVPSRGTMYAAAASYAVQEPANGPVPAPKGPESIPRPYSGTPRRRRTSPIKNKGRRSMPAFPHIGAMAPVLLRPIHYGIAQAGRPPFKFRRPSVSGGEMVPVRLALCLRRPDPHIIPQPR